MERYFFGFLKNKIMVTTKAVATAASPEGREKVDGAGEINITFARAWKGLTLWIKGFKIKSEIIKVDNPLTINDQTSFLYFFEKNKANKGK